MSEVSGLEGTEEHGLNRFDSARVFYNARHPLAKQFALRIETILSALKLEQHLHKFVESGILDLCSLKQCTENQLQKLDIPKGGRMKVLIGGLY